MMVLVFFLSDGFVPLIWDFIFVDHKWLCPLDMIVLFFFNTDGYVPLIW
jgi:hypothetical protein